MSRVTRRQFMAGSLAAGAWAMAAPYSRALGASDDIRVAVVGFNSQGGVHIQQFLKIPGVRLVALCDADSRVIERGLKALGDQGGKVQTYQDVRKLLENKDVDALSTATPNHWHALITVWACQAGKDVYVEKPTSHEIWEGRKAVEAARKYNRIVQGGTQGRSNTGLREAFEWIKAGNIGKIVVARGFCYKPRGSIGKVTAPTPIPPEVDYDLWCGPAPKEPLMRKKLHYDWHWVWPTGNGDIGNQGIHEMDMCRWALGQAGLAPRVFSIGGRFVHDDDATTPNTLVSFYDYKPAPLIFEVRGLPRKTGDTAMDNYRGTRTGLVVECEGGYFAGGQGGGWTYDKDGKKIKQFPATGAEKHQDNFIQAVRSRKREDLTADILEGHLSSALCHMGNISYRLGAGKPPDQIAETIKGDKMHAECFGRFLEHIKANEADLAKTPIILGPWLDMDCEKEQFTGALAAKANELVTRRYREPFVVPDKV